MNNVVKLRVVPRREERPMEDALTGKSIKRRFATRYWFDGREREPSRFARGFPRSEEGSIEGAGRVIMKGWCSKVQCFDRASGEVLWTLKRGPKLRGRNIWTVLSYSGEA